MRVASCQRVCVERAFSRGRRLAGFTMVEMLVSISIIAVLLGLLLPVLSSARESGRRAVCLANLRTFGQAIEMYAGHNFPEPFPFAAEGFHALAGWEEPLASLEPYLGVPPPTFDEDLKRAVDVSETLICPSDPGVWRIVGWSYFYFPAQMMQFPEDLLGRVAPAYLRGPPSDSLPVLLDQGFWHHGSQQSERKNALRLDGSAGPWRTSG